MVGPVESAIARVLRTPPGGVSEFSVDLKLEGLVVARDRREREKGTENAWYRKFIVARWMAK